VQQISACLSPLRVYRAGHTVPAPYRESFEWGERLARQFYQLISAATRAGGCLRVPGKFFLCPGSVCRDERTIVFRGSWTLKIPKGRISASSPGKLVTCNLRSCFDLSCRGSSVNQRSTSRFRRPEIVQTYCPRDQGSSPASRCQERQTSRVQLGRRSSRLLLPFHRSL